MMGLSGIRAGVAALIGALVVLGGCGRSFGPGFTPGEAILAPASMAEQNISGCEAEGIQGLRGQHFAALSGVALRGQLRVLRPGQGLTRDLVANRLNVQVDPEGRVLRMFCG